MDKLLHGGGSINYGPQFPTLGTAFDGTLFFKNTGSDSGLYVFAHSSETAALAQGQILKWVPLATTELFVSKKGDTIDGQLIIKGANTSSAYNAAQGVLRLVNTSSTVGARSGALQWSYANSTAPAAQIDILNGTAGAADMSFGLFSQGSMRQVMKLVPAGLMNAAGKPYWHEDNDGVGTNLDAGKLAGNLPAFYQNASNINAGTLNIARFPYVPVQQGGGNGQGTNKIHIGWNAASSKLHLQVDSTNFADTWPISINGNAATANRANNADAAITAEYATNASFLHFDGGTATGKLRVNKTTVTTNPTFVLGATTFAGGTGTTTAQFHAVSSLNVASADIADKLRTARTINGVPFDGSANITVADNTKVAKGGDTMSGALRISATTQSTSRTTGALVVSGGVGIDRALNVGGDITTDGNTITRSDARVKHDIREIENALEKVGKLRGTTYGRDNVEGRQAGLIAQDFVGVLDEVVYEDANSLLGVNYNGVVALLVQAVNELQAQVDELKKQK